MEGQRFYFFSGQLFFIGGRKRTRQGRPFTSTTPQALELKRTQNRRRRKKNERRTCRLHDRVSSGSETKGQRLFFPFFAFASLPFFFYFFPFCLPVSVYDSWYFANGQSKKHIQSTSCRQCNCTDEFTVSDEKNVRRWATSECFRKLKIPPPARTIAPKQGEKKKNNFTRNQHNNPYVPGQKEINTNKINTRCNAMRVDCTAVAFRLTCRVYVCVCVCVCALFSPHSLSLTWLSWCWFIGRPSRGSVSANARKKEKSKTKNERKRNWAQPANKTPENLEEKKKEKRRLSSIHRTPLTTAVVMSRVRTTIFSLIYFRAFLFCVFRVNKNII